MSFTTTNYYTNSDGLVITFGNAQGQPTNIGSPHQAGTVKTIIADIKFSDLAAFGTTNYIFGGIPEVFVPNGALIVSAVFTVTTAFAGTSATLDIGLGNNDATAIDFDGLFAALAQTAMDAVGETTTGGGALIGTKIAADGYITTNVNTATFTAGAGRLVVTYFVPTP